MARLIPDVDGQESQAVVETMCAGRVRDTYKSEMTTHVSAHGDRNSLAERWDDVIMEFQWNILDNVPPPSLKLSHGGNKEQP